MNNLIKQLLNSGFLSFLGFIILFIFPYVLIAQKPALRNYTNVDGLPSNEVYMILQDKSGYIWMATNYGVCRFDGYNFEKFTTKDGLTDNTVFELFEDYKGRIWFITSNLKFSYFENKKIYQYHYNENINKFIPWAPYYENRSFYVDSSDNIFFSVFTKGAFKITHDGIVSAYKLNKLKNRKVALLYVSANKFIPFRIINSDSIYYEYNDKWKIIKNRSINMNKVLYFNSMNLVASNKKWYFAEDKVIYVFNTLGVNTYKMSDYIISLDEDKAGNIWVGFRNNGAVCFPGGNFNKLPFLHILRGIPVSKIFADSEGGLWFSTLTNGVFYTPSLSVLSYTISEGLVNNQINSLYVGKNDEVSVFSRNNVYSIIKDMAVINKKENVPEDEMINIVQNRFQRKWICTNKMVYIHESGNIISLFDKSNNLEKYRNPIWPATSVLEVDSDLTYISFTSNIFKIYKNDITVLTAPYTLLGITNLCLGNDSILYFGSKIGPGRLEGDSFKMFYLTYPELKMKVNHLLFDKKKNSLWIATKGDGIYILKDNKLTNMSVQNGLSSNYVKHFCQKEDQMWVSTNAGINLIYLEKPQDTLYHVKIINSTMGLVSNEVNGICVSGNYVYAATDKGLSFFDPSGMKFGFNINKPVKITGVQINERDTQLFKTYNLPYNIDNILISFKYLSYSNAGKNNYLYRLKGLSDQWQMTTSTEIRFTTLPPGKYLFEIKCVFPDNTVTENAASIEIIINKPYWETWWFISFIVLFATLLIYILYRYRINVISRQNKLKLQLIEYQSKALSSQINPHFIFNSLNSIQLYILNNDIVKSNKYLSKFSHLMRSVLDNSQESSIILENEIKTLTNYIEIESLRFNNRFEYEIITDSQLDLKKTRIPTLLIQPFVENAIWHGFMNKEGKGFLSISLTNGESTIKCIIQDNGIGRKKSAEINAQKSSTHKSLGAQITQERISLLNAQFRSNLKITTTDIYDASDCPNGTKVEIIIPKIPK